MVWATCLTGLYRVLLGHQCRQWAHEEHAVRISVSCVHRMFIEWHVKCLNEFLSSRSDSVGRFSPAIVICFVTKSCWPSTSKSRVHLLHLSASFQTCNRKATIIRQSSHGTFFLFDDCCFQIMKPQATIGVVFVVFFPSRVCWFQRCSSLFSPC